MFFTHQYLINIFVAFGAFASHTQKNVCKKVNFSSHLIKPIEGLNLIVATFSINQRFNRQAAKKVFIQARLQSSIRTFM